METRMKPKECVKCKYKWLPRVERVKQCPRCKKYLEPIKKVIPI